MLAFLLLVNRIWLTLIYGSRILQELYAYYSK